MAEGILPGRTHNPNPGQSVPGVPERAVKIINGYAGPCQPWSPPAIKRPVVEELVPTGPTPEELEAARLAIIEEEARQRGFADGQQKGYAAGFETGRAAGFTDGSAEATRLAEQIRLIFDALRRPLENLEAECVAAMGELAGEIAQSILRVAYIHNPMMLQALASATISEAGKDARDIEIRMNPADIGDLAALLTTAPEISPVADDTLERGDLRLHTSVMQIDATVRTRVAARLAETISNMAREEHE